MSLVKQYKKAQLIEFVSKTVELKINEKLISIIIGVQLSLILIVRV